jgi:hypothetical protein
MNANETAAGDAIIARGMRAFLEGKNLFITGAAGTGKTYLLHQLHALYSQQDDFVTTDFYYTATTGLAASLLPDLHGSTIHEWSGMRLGEETVNTIVKRLRTRKNQPNSAYNRWLLCKVLVRAQKYTSVRRNDEFSSLRTYSTCFFLIFALTKLCVCSLPTAVCRLLMKSACLPQNS